ncbi:MAG: hypothetical protein IPK16_11655 [Anaerolineales bacterium]|nr:hypothetical protein [Anaerolineales bacterium]
MDDSAVGGYNFTLMTVANWGFDLFLDHTEDGYRATVTQSPAGDAWAAFTLPFKPREQHAMIQQLLVDAGEDEPRRNDQFRLARDLGGRLFEAILHGPLRECWQESWRRAYAERATLHVRLRLGDSPSLHMLPWEYLYDVTRDEFLALSAHTPLTRFQERSHQPLPVDLEPPLRVLVVMAGPEGYPPLPVGREWRNLVDTVDHLAADRRVLLNDWRGPPCSIYSDVCASRNTMCSISLASASMTRRPRMGC